MRQRRTRGAHVTTAFAAALLLVLAVTAQPAAAAPVAVNAYFLNQSLCEVSRAGIDEVVSGTHKGWEASSWSKTINCVDNLATYAGWLAVDGVLWDAPYPTPSICGAANSHPSGDDHSPVVALIVPIGPANIPNTCTDFAAYGCFWVASSSNAWAFTYPGVWHGPGGVITSFAPWWCPG